MVGLNATAKSVVPPASVTSAPASRSTNSLVDAYPVPQDPFLPVEPLGGPVFLDDNGCVCAFQGAPNGTSTKPAWRCQGNQGKQNAEMYNGTSGKWFVPKVPADLPSMIPYDNSNPPDLSTPYIYDNKTSLLVPIAAGNGASLSAYDAACTGINETTFSTAFYLAAEEEDAGVQPIDAVPCLREGALPIRIQNVTAFQADGCAKGFFCPNNTVNSLPQYCYPVDPCAQSRLAGNTCFFGGVNVPMGRFEPVLCTPGFYCPKGTKEQLKCPVGHYCPPGSDSAVPCAAGSNCAEGSQNQTILVPLILVLLLDVILALTLVGLKLRDRARAGKKSPIPIIRKHIRLADLKDRKAGYRSIEEDAEEIAMDAIIRPVRRVPTGFQAAIDMATMEDDSSTINLDIEATPELMSFVSSMKKAIQGTTFGLSIDFQQLKFQPKGASKPILSEVSGSIKSGSLVGVMGGSGAGKSTFVNVLMGRTTHTGGMVKVNGVTTKMKNYKKVIGYVPQDDIVLPELTVRENILFSARIRLPSSWSDKDIQAHTDAIVDCLDLAHVKDSRVGSVAKPVISGGQRKRVSIGIELAAAPMALFLDEPTSGLDATSASTCMKILKALSQLGISIVVIIHQPRIEIFETIDELILLGNGRLIYQGKEREVQRYFENVGFHFPDNCNAADVVTDIITGNGRPYKRVGEVSKEALISNWAAVMATRQRRDSVLSQAESASLRRSIKGRGAPIPRQLYYALGRALLQQYRTIATFWFELGIASFGGFLIGLAQNGQQGVNFKGFFLGDYQILSVAIDYHSVPQMALLVCISIGLIASAPGVRVFSEESLVFRREAASGHNRFAYYLAKVLSTIPRIVMGAFHFTTFFILLATPLIPWGASFVSNLLYFYCIYGLASIVSMIVRPADGPLFAVVASLIVGVLSGAAPPLVNVDSWHLAWLWKCSPGVWLAEIYFGKNVAPLAYLYNVQNAADATGFALHRFPVDLLALLVIGTVYRVIAFGGLMLRSSLRT